MSDGTRPQTPALAPSRTTTTAQHDASLSAVVVSQRPLYYGEGADQSADRPAHVRAASGLTWIHGQLGLVQDDANFVAIVDPDRMHARSIALPRGDDGLRQFDDARGNKKHKSDFESCTTIIEGAAQTLLAFGSGSKRNRRTVLLVEGCQTSAPTVRMIAAKSLYKRLEAERRFAGSDLNIEGAVVRDAAVCLITRGNGKAKNGDVPRNAICRMPLDALREYLENPENVDPPRPFGVDVFDLGELNGLPLGFTDAAVCNDSLLFSAAAEASPDAQTDGAVSGSAIGVIDAGGRARFTPLRDPSGAPVLEKVEGLVMWPHDHMRAWAVVDADDAQRPSLLCEVQLSGPWW
ncbi:MAG: hypothetical protein IT353_00250 [Gemmatimonadaceae bacterium]|nr:hypothetical protein [Gemmatimonadaceae bacterium]